MLNGTQLHACYYDGISLGVPCVLQRVKLGGHHDTSEELINSNAKVRKIPLAN